jgi:transposase-like protein
MITWRRLMPTTIEDLIRGRATAMAAHDGAPVASVAHIMGAASVLQAELISARDNLLSHPAGSAHQPGIAEAPPVPKAKASAPADKAQAAAAEPETAPAEDTAASAPAEVTDEASDEAEETAE